ncbi:glycosyltransferase [Marimonas arenosa]|uniref:Glycosyltransferase n=1 Tax=Marimonas arenosa TaxID=1795305 RepID=A0AAE3WEJ3_9RHOB|nr:glycosyltransferase [Marimonas arenosa]MDQ2090272.1 glycosyltransferase [Marimonas arenosa]
MLGKLLRPALIKRFFASIREEGLGQALRKVRIYLGMVLRGGGRSALGRRGGEVSRDHLYLNKIWQQLARQNAFHVAEAPALLSKRRKIALIADMNLPQCRKYRVEQLAEFWRKRDVEVEYSHYLDVPRSAHAMQDATHLFEYRLQTMPVTEMYRYEARRLKLPVLYDLDDPLFSISAYETYENMKAIEPELKAHFISEAPRYLAMMNGADMITVSTPGMVEHTREYTPRPVFLRRNFADAATLSDGLKAMQSGGAARTEDKLFRVAFASGSRGHEVDFALIEDQLAGFLDGGPNRRLMIIGHFDEKHLPEVFEDRIESHPFTTYDDYLATLAGADCAVMPLTDDIFNRCKSAVRVIDAASVGVPSIVGTVSDMANVVRHEETGFVAQTPADWGAALEALAGDAAAALAMGRRAREDLETNWSGHDASHIISPEVLAWVRA